MRQVAVGRQNHCYEAIRQGVAVPCDLSVVRQGARSSERTLILTTIDQTVTRASSRSFAHVQESVGSCTRTTVAGSARACRNGSPRVLRIACSSFAAPRTL